jgi:hypothetical protein
MYKTWNIWGERFVTFAFDGVVPSLSLQVGFEYGFYLHFSFLGVNLSTGLSIQF